MLSEEAIVYLTTVILALYHDKRPRSFLWPWMNYLAKVDVRKGWSEAPGPLGPVRSELYKHVRSTSSDTGRQIERAYFGDYLPRNEHLGKPFVVKLKKALGTVVKPKHFMMLSVEQIVELFRLLGLGRTKPTLHPEALHLVNPAKTYAAVGMVYDRYFDKYLFGKKVNFWNDLRCTAEDRWADIDGRKTLKLDEQLSKREYWTKKHKLCYIPMVRTDTGKGAQSPRLIWCGDSPSYILEVTAFSGLLEDLRKLHRYIPHQWNHVQDVLEHFYEQGKKLISKDFSSWDLTQCREAMERVWKAVAILYDLPEDLVSYLMTYNTNSPIYAIDPVSGELILLHRDGKQPSGSGAFAPINHLLHIVYDASIMVLVLGYSIAEAAACLGQYTGDDGWLADDRGALWWSEQYLKLFGIRLKPKQTVESNDEIVFLRRRHRVGEPSYMPVFMSRFRNLLCPKTTDPANAPHALVSISLRAQLLEIVQANKEFAGKFGKIMKTVCRIVPYERLRWEVSDKQLVRELPGWVRAKEDKLYWVKRYAYGQSSNNFDSRSILEEMTSYY